MRWCRVVFSGAVLATVLACSGLPAPAAPPPPVAAPAPVPAPAAGFHAPRLPDLPSGAGAPSDQVAHYLADCHYREMVDSDDGPGKVDECNYLEFDQNCSPDPSGCFDKGQQCKAACGDPCVACQDACANTCDGCKQVCKGDPTCQRGCAEGRAACRTGCLTVRTACTDDACGKVAGDCDAAWEKQLATECPDCTAIKACQQAGDAGCGEKYPKDDASCLEWCMPEQ